MPLSLSLTLWNPTMGNGVKSAVVMLPVLSISTKIKTGKPIMPGENVASYLSPHGRADVNTAIGYESLKRAKSACLMGGKS